MLMTEVCLLHFTRLGIFSTPSLSIMTKLLETKNDGRTPCLRLHQRDSMMQDIAGLVWLQ